MTNIILLPPELDLIADMAQLTIFANSLGVAIEDNHNEHTLASALITYIDQLPEADWDAMDPAVQEWSNVVNAQVLEIKKKAEAAPKTPKAAAGKTPKVKTPKAKQTVSGGDSCSTMEESINTLTKKADIIATATAFGKSTGKKIHLPKSWSVAKLKEEAIKQLTTAEPETEPEPEPEKPKAASPKRVSGNASAKEPSPKAVKAAKAGAQAKAQAAKSVSTGQGKGREEGEPFRRNTTAWIVWDVFRRSKKALTMAEATERYLKEFEKSGLSSSNPAGRVPRVVQCMVHDLKVAKRNDDSTYELV